jgi:catechol 2,3-dioxygenase-like lactoylglutathione lyase family enzyme
MSRNIEYNGGLTLSMSVTNLDAAIAWYEDVLGFKLIYRLDEMGWCEVASGVERVNVGLSVTEKHSPGGATPTFGVNDIDAAKASLESKGVKLDDTGIVIIPDLVKLLTFYDQDGNSLMFYQDLQSHE